MSGHPEFLAQSWSNYAGRLSFLGWAGAQFKEDKIWNRNPLSVRPRASWDRQQPDMRPNCSRFPEFLNLWEQRDELRDDLFGRIDFGKRKESLEA